MSPRHSRAALPQVDDIEGQDLAIDRRQAALPTRHMALPSAPHRPVDRPSISTIDPDGVCKIRSADIHLALGVFAMAGDTVLKEHGPAGCNLLGGCIGDSSAGEAAHESDDVVHG